MGLQFKTAVQRIDWRRAAAEWDCFGDINESLAERALDRLEHGDVTRTQYGIRVALRPDLGDDRAEANAYWPNLTDDSCRCWAYHTRGGCSHLAAALLFELVTRPDED